VKEDAPREAEVASGNVKRAAMVSHQLKRSSLTRQNMEIKRQAGERYAMFA